MSNDCWTTLALPGDVAGAVTACKAFKERFGSLAVFPYNQHQPVLSVWWLFPAGKTKSQAWPAYRTGKYVFYKPWKTSAMRCGLAIEKGVGAEMAKVYRAPSIQMKADWIWASFVDGLEAGNLQPAFDTIRARSGSNPLIEVEVEAPLDKPELRQACSRCRFTAGAGGQIEVAGFEQQGPWLAGVEDARTTAALGRRLRELSARERDVLWVNLFVGLELPVSTTGSGKPWSGTDIWSRVLEPLAGWVRAGA